MSMSTQNGTRYRPAPSTCIICIDFLLAYDDNADMEKEATDSSQLLRPIVTTKCGHLFHTTCIIEWFKGKNQELKPCPYCRRNMRWCDIKRIFPISSGEE